MNNIKRFDMCHIGDGVYCMLDSGDGAFVVYEEHQKVVENLTVELAACKIAMNYLKSGYQDVTLNTPTFDTIKDKKKIAYEISGFGRFSKNYDTGLNIVGFKFENGNTPKNLEGSFVPKYALQAIINSLQEECDNMDEKPLDVIWPIDYGYKL